MILQSQFSLGNSLKFLVFHTKSFHVTRSVSVAKAVLFDAHDVSPRVRNSFFIGSGEGGGLSD